MPVCLHCGEIGEEGALFCAKCGFTLPQPGATSAPGPPHPPEPVPPPVASPGFLRASPWPPLRTAPSYGPPGAYAVPVPHVPGAVAPIPPPPNAKYCVRCATLISRAAVYCPVCQQPQA